ncbi:hypothetical protein PC110_g20618 [Phytophthora cactorum]|nr:hypothetical protein PC110_g20618 [Phytophthora cactorum]
MEAATSDFVTMISSILGKSVLNWYHAFSSDCEQAGTPKTWSLFKAKLRERFRPKDFEYNLRERLFQMKQNGTIHEYVSSFQDLMSQSELKISEMEKLFYFQNGLRAETAKKVKELSPRFLHEVIEIATNFEFAHYGGQAATSSTVIQSFSKATTNAKPGNNKQIMSSAQKQSAKSEPKEDWESRPHVIIVDSSGTSSRSVSQAARSTTISLNGVIEDLAMRLQLDITKHHDVMMTVRLRYNQTVQQPGRTVELKLQIPDFPVTVETFTAMPVPEDKDVMLGMRRLRENNPDIDWERLLLHPRARTEALEPFQLVVPNRPPARVMGGRRFKNASQNREVFTTTSNMATRVRSE